MVLSETASEQHAWIRARGSSLHKHLLRLRDPAAAPRDIFVFDESFSPEDDWPPVVEMWDVKVYRMRLDRKAQRSEYSFIVEYRTGEHCEIVLREPGGGAAFPLSVLGCEYPVDMPKELGGAGAGFAGASAGFGGASDGRMKVAMMLSRHHDASGAHKLQQDPLGPKGRKDSELARTKEGFLIYSERRASRCASIQALRDSLRPTRVNCLNFSVVDQE
jgi:hypothetical protein